MASQDPVNWFLPAAFYFSVKLQGEPRIGEVAFREVSGLSAEMEFEEVACGGMNDHKLLLPKGVKHANVVLKRAMTSDYGYTALSKAGSPRPSYPAMSK